MAVDYEVEYDNRGRVPEHMAILQRMAEQALRYRAERTAESRAELDVRYGPSPRQIVDIFRPDRGVTGPVTIFIHGGYWRSLQPSAFSGLAAGLNARGVTVAMVGYDLCPQASISEIIGQITQACLFLHRREGQRLLVSGHSAGGHLAAAMLATDWRAFNADVDLTPAAMAISGLFDLAPLMATAMNADLRLDRAEARRLSPLFWPAPVGRVFDAVVGGAESSEFLRQSRCIADAWAQAGVKTRFDAPEGANHFTVIEPLANADSVIVQRLAEMHDDVRRL